MFEIGAAKEAIGFLTGPVKTFVSMLSPNQKVELRKALHTIYFSPKETLLFIDQVIEDGCVPRNDSKFLEFVEFDNRVNASIRVLEDLTSTDSSLLPISFKRHLEKVSYGKLDVRRELYWLLGKGKSVSGDEVERLKEVREKIIQLNEAIEELDDKMGFLESRK